MTIDQQKNDIEVIENAFKAQNFDKNIVQNLIKILSKSKNKKLLEILRVLLRSENDFWRRVAVDKLIYYKEKINHQDTKVIKKSLKPMKILKLK